MSFRMTRATLSRARRIRAPRADVREGPERPSGHTISIGRKSPIDGLHKPGCRPVALRVQQKTPRGHRLYVAYTLEPSGTLLGDFGFDS